MVHVYQWVPGIVAIITVIANAAITYSAVSRHERVLEKLDDAVGRLETEVAVLRASCKKGGDGR